MVKKFLQDYFSYRLSRVFGGRRYTDWAKKNLTLFSNIPVKNKKLSQELEDACAKKGYLTYKEFLTIDQFGANGFHNTHKRHGMTDTKFRWPEALAALCKAKEIHHLVEFGPGDGEIGVRTIQEAKRLHHELFWSGIEISEILRKKAQKLFHKNHIEKYLLQLVATLDEITIKEKCLFVFSYSLDNLIPDVFINTSKEKGVPNAMLGVTAKGGLLSEILINPSVIPAKAGIQENRSRVKPGMTREDGIFTDSQGFSWDLTDWKLHPMQRAYLPLEVLRTLLHTADIIPSGSHILIIDEFRTNELRHQPTFHLGLPRDLETYSRDFVDIEKFYKTAGSNLLYFPPFIDSLISFLSQIGFALEEHTGEHRLAFRLAGRNNPYPKYPRTLALLTSPKKRDVKKKKFVLFASSDRINNTTVPVV